MTDLTPVASLDGVYQLETTDLALAGSSPSQTMNKQAQALLNRDAFRADQIAANAANVTALQNNLANTADPAKGAGQVGFASTLPYLTGTVGSALKALAINVIDKGADPTGATSSTAAFIDARAESAVTGKFVYAPAGHYKLNAALTSAEDLKIIGDGDATILDFTGTVTGGDYALEALGTATQIQELSGSQAVGQHTVLFVSAPSLVVGDVFCIFNPTTFSWSGFRSNYFAGEFCEVESISGNTVTVKSPLYDTYAAAAVDVYKIAGPDVVLRDFKIIGTTVLGLIHPQFCITPLMENLTAEHANDSIIYADRCFRPMINNPNVRNVGDGGDDYGIVVGNSQHSRINGGSAYSRRHSVTHGGGAGICSVPVRDSRVNGVLLRNDIASGTEAADFHGNTEDSSYINCTIYGGANLQGKDNHYDGCRITNGAAGYCLYHSEVKGGRLGAKNCDLISYVNPQAGGRGVHDIGSQNDAVTANTVLPATFFLDGCTVNGRNWTSSSYITRFRNAGCTQATNFEITGLSCDVNALSIVLLTSSDSGTPASDRIVIDDVRGLPAGTILHNPSGSSYLNFPHRLQKQSGQVSLTATSGTAITIAAPINLAYVYPRVPSGFATTTGDIVGNRHAIAGLFTLSATAIRPMIFTGDQVNWNATANRSVSWSVDIAEV